VGSKAKQSEIVVINDEAHHCYQDKPIEIEGESADSEDKDRNADARVWFKGMQAIARKVGVKAVYDLSATPFYLKGSGYKEGFIFPWVVSDFSLMDAIESGIVKVPRTPVDDDANHDAVVPTCAVGPDRRSDSRSGTARMSTPAAWVPFPEELEGALRSLYRSYERAFGTGRPCWRRRASSAGLHRGLPNTAVSKLVYDWIAGFSLEAPTTVRHGARGGQLGLLQNVVDGCRLARPNTILVDSAQLESGEGMKNDFKKVAAAAEIEAFKRSTACATPAPTSTRSPTRICCARS
jgi:type III restriction enzyme